MADTTGTDDTTAVEIGTATAKVVRPSGDDTRLAATDGLQRRVVVGLGRQVLALRGLILGAGHDLLVEQGLFPFERGFRLVQLRFIRCNGGL